jgi:hypothetical protein
MGFPRTTRNLRTPAPVSAKKPWKLLTIATKVVGAIRWEMMAARN